MKLFKYLFIMGIIMLGVFSFDFLVNSFNKNIVYLIYIFLILNLITVFVLKKIEKNREDIENSDNKNEFIIYKILGNVINLFILTCFSGFFLILGGIGENNINQPMMNLGPGHFLPYIISGYIIYLSIKLIIKLPKKTTYTIPLSIYLLFIIVSFLIFYKNTDKIIMTINNKTNHEAWKNKDSILFELNQNFKEPRTIKDVGITKYRDFYIITSKDEILIPYPRTPKNTKNDLHIWDKSDILPDSEKLLNLKKIIGQQVDVKALASSKIPYGFLIKGINFKDNYPLSNNEYFMVEIIIDGKVLNINNFELCNTEKDKGLDYYCDNIYQGQRWMGM